MVEWVKYSGMSWAKDGSGFYYSRYPAPKQGSAYQALTDNHEIYFHKLGTQQSTDQRIFATPGRPELYSVGEVSDDGQWLIASSLKGISQAYEVSLIDLKNPGAKARVLIPGFEHNYSFIGNRGSIFYFITDDGSPRQKIVTLDIARSSPTPQTVVPEDKAKLESAALIGGDLIVSYLADAKSDVRVHALDGTLKKRVELPGIGSTEGFLRDFDGTETFFTFTSFNRPTTIYQYDIKSGRAAVWAAPKLAFNPDDYRVEQIFYPSKDGNSNSDVRRSQDQCHRARTNFAVRLWRGRDLDDSVIFRDASRLARERRRLCPGECPRRR